MKRPLIVSEPVSEFGPTTVTQDQLDRGMAFSEDMTYVPGWSDLRQQREAEMQETAEALHKWSALQASKP